MEKLSRDNVEKIRKYLKERATRERETAGCNFLTCVPERYIARDGSYKSVDDASAICMTADAAFQ